MVYNRYIKKGGKVYGPYSYSNHKEKGKVVTEYIGKESSVKGKKIISPKIISVFVILFLVLSLLAGFFYFKPTISGFAIDEFGNEILEGKTSFGLTDAKSLEDKIKDKQGILNLKIIEQEGFENYIIYTINKINETRFEVRYKLNETLLKDINDCPETEKKKDDKCLDKVIEKYIKDEKNQTKIDSFKNSANNIKDYPVNTSSKTKINDKVDLSKEGVFNIDLSDYDKKNFSKFIGEKIKVGYNTIIFEFYIEISSAVHLNSSREFISDIYDSVKYNDSNWSETIKQNEYVRVSFEKNLTNKNDITIYARGNNSTIEVYEKDGTNLIATFPVINSENWSKIYLTNLTHSQDTFDLKVSNNTEFDYIIDPTFSITDARPVALAPLTTNKFALAWCDKSVNDIIFKIYDTNGTNITGDITVDNSVYDCALNQLSVSAFNSTSFVVGYADNDAEDAMFAIYDSAGNQLVAPISADTAISYNSVVAVSAFNSTAFAIGWWDKADGDSTFAIYDSAGNQLVAPIDADTNVVASQSVSISAFNSTSFVFSWYNGSSIDLAIYDFAGNNLTNIINAVEPGTGSYTVTTSAFNSTAFVLGWQNFPQDDVAFKIYDSAGNNLTGDINAIDNLYGGYSTVSVAALNSTAFAISWFNLPADTFAVYTSGGTLLAGPINSTNNAITGYQYNAVASYSAATNIGFCSQNFIHAYDVNATGADWASYHSDGTAWDGICGGAVDNPPASILSRPANNNVTDLGVVTFECNATDDNNLKNVTLYVWNSSGGIITTNFTSWTGTTNSTTFTYNFSFYNSTKWNCLVYDNASQNAWGTNRSLNISAPTVYSVQITSPTTSSPLSVTSNENISVYFNFLQNSANITSGVTLNNLTIGGIFANLVTTAKNLNYTEKSCGVSCNQGSPLYCTNNILADSCTGASSCDGTDAVVDLWLNGTSFHPTDKINVTMAVRCDGVGDEVKIWYYNGSVWNEEFYDATCDYPGTVGNYSINVNITSSNATQYIRGQVTFGTLNGSNQCYNGTFGDDDDINFSVVAETTNQYGYVIGKGWEANVTVPTGLTGLQDLFVNATYSSYTRTDTETGAINYVADTTAPNINITSPTNGTNSSNAGLNINYTASDLNLQSCWYSNDSYSANTTLANCQTNITTIIWAQGNHNVTIWANDSAGNINSSSVTFNIDSIYPLFSNYYDNNASILDSGIGLFNVTVVNTNGTVWLEIDGTNITAKNLTANVYNASHTFTVGGTYAYRWWAYSNGTLHNYNKSDERSYIVNVTDVSPNINFTNPTPSNGSTQSGNSIYVNVSTSDASDHSTFLDFNRTLMGWWSFDFYNTTGVYDNSSYNNFGTFQGTSTSNIVTGIRGKGMQFNGVNNSISVPDSSLSGFTNGLTVSLWIKSNTTNDVPIADFSGTSGGYGIYCDGNWYTANGSAFLPVDAGRLTDNSWHMYTLIWNITNLISYRDGNLLASANGVGSLFPSASLTLGVDNRGPAPCAYFNGSLDDVLIFSRALSSSEISSLYNTSAYQYRNNFTNLTNANYNFTAYAIDSSGNLNKTETRIVTVGITSDTTPPYFTAIPANASLNYLQALDVDFNASDETAFGFYAVNDTRFTINSSGGLKNNTILGVAVYLINITINDSSNNLNSTIYQVNVSKIAPTLTYSINSQLNNISITYPQQVNASASTTGGTVKLYRNDVDVTTENGLNQTLGAANYTYIFNVTGNQNYSNIALVTMTINVSQNTSSKIYTYLNNSRNNITIYNNTAIWLNATLFNATGTIYLYKNGTLINSGNSPLSNLTSFNGTGLYNITAIYPSNTNYSGSSETWYVNVTPPDTIKPNINITYPVNGTNSSNINLNVNYTVSDNIAISSCWYSNDSYSVNTTLSNCANLTTIVWSQGKHNVTIWTNDTSNNLNSSFVSFNIDSIGPVCTLLNRTPSNLVDNSTGVLTVIMNCTDINGVNLTKLGDHYAFFITRTVDAFVLAAGIPNYWSNRYPNNSLGVVGNLTPPYKIWRALGRNEGYWYDSITTLNKTCEGINPCYNILNDTFSYAIEDGEYGHFTITAENTANTSVIINYTHPAVDVAAFRQSVYLSYESMVKESKKNYTIRNNNYLLMKRFDAEAYRNTQNYTMNSFRNLAVTGAPSKTFRAFYCNSSYNPAGSVQVINSPNCALINSLTSTEINNRIFTDRNSSYSKGTYGIINGHFGGIKATAEFYIEYESPETAAGKSYELRYANGTTNTDVPFNQTNVAWITTNGGTTWVQANFTPDVFTTSTRSANDEFDFGYYATDMYGNAGYNFSLVRDEITPTNHPISYPIVLEYNNSALNYDINLNGTHKGIMQIKIGCAKDPDSVGNVTHNLTLRNTDGTWNYTINGSFLCPNDLDLWINFNTSLVPDGKYRTNITAYSGDNSADVKSRITDRNFTIDNTQPAISITTPLNNSNSSNVNLDVNYTLSDITSSISSCWYSNDSYSVNTTLSNCVNLTTIVWSDGYHNVTIWANDTVNNVNKSSVSFRIDSLPPYFTNLQTQTIADNQTLNYDINAVDDGVGLGSFAINWTTNFSIVASTGVLSNSTHLSAGTYYINVSVNDTLGNLNSSVLQISVTSTADTTPPYFTTIPANASLNYLQALNVIFSAADETAFGTYAVNDTRFTINSSGGLKNNTILGVALYLINITINDSSNNLNSTIYQVNVSKIAPTLTYSINSQLNNISITYPQQVNASASTTGGTVKLYRNDVDVTTENGLNQTLGVTNYTYIFNVTGNQNYSNIASVTMTINISQNTSSKIYTYLNNSRNNITIYNNTAIWLNATLFNSTGTIYLYKNNTLINSGNSPLSNLTSFNGTGLYNITAIYPSNTNYSGSSETWYVNVTSTADTTPPYFTAIPANASLNYLQALDVDFNASDETAFGFYSVNDTRFTINSSGGLKNNTILGVALYLINITINDSSNNLNSTIYQVNVSKIASQTSLTFDKTNPQSYPNAITPTCSVISGQGTTTLTNGTSGSQIVLGVGNWTFNCSLASSQNYTESSNTTIFNITQNTTYVLSLAITPSTIVTYPTETTATGSGCPSELICNLSLNTSGIVANPHVITLGVGVYNYTYNSTGNENYSIMTTSSILTVAQNTSSKIYTYLNNSRNNITIYNNTAIWLNATLFNVTGTIYLYKNNTLINSGNSPLSNLTSFNGTGLYNITAIYPSNTNYSGSSETWYVNVTAIADSTNPIVNIIYPVPKFNSSNTGLNINYTASDNVAISACWYSNDSMSLNIPLANCANITTVTWAEGPHNITIWANDTTNNLGSASVNFTIDTINPEINITSLVNGTNSSNVNLDINYTVSDLHLTGCWYSNDSYSVNTTLSNCANLTSIVWSQGYHNVTIWANDSAGNENSSSVSFSIDTTKPAISITYPTTNNTNSSNTGLNINYTVSDVHLSTCWYSNDSMSLNITLANCGTNITTVVWSQGRHNVTIWVNDTVNNFNQTGVNFTIDSLPPYFTNLANQTLIEGQSLNYDINANDTGVGLGSFAINWTTKFTIVSSTGILTNSSALALGLYDINVSVNDTLGNLNSSVITLNVSVAADLVNPLINILSPVNTTYATTTISFNLSSNENLSSCLFSINNWATNYTMDLNASLTGTNYTNSTMGQGSYIARFWCNDTSNNINNSEYVSFFIDSVYPEINMSYPQNTSYNSNVSTLNYTYTEINPVLCWYSLNGGANSTPVSCGTNWTGLTSNEGSNTWIVYINDSAGNKNSSSVTFFKDSINSVISYGTGTLANGTTSKNDWIYVNVSVDEINEDTITFLLYNTSGEFNSTSYTDSTRTINWTGLSDGTYYYNVTVNDTLNNKNSTQTRTIIINTTLEITLIAPINNSGDNDGNISFVYSIDGTGIVSNCSLMFNNSINQTNLTITKAENMNFYLNNLPPGRYNWSVNCTQNNNTVIEGEQRIFSVVITNYFSGTTTNLSDLNVTNITNLVLQAPTYGEINFSQDINLENGTDIDASVNISFNRIEVNTTILPELNKTARLYFYGLSFSNPRPLKNGVVCTTCTEVSYSGGTFVYDVTGFSIYSSEETPVTPVTTPSGGGGGGSTFIEQNNFTLSPKIYQRTIILNRIEFGEIEIYNERNTETTFSIGVESVGNIISILNSTIRLNPGETKKAKFRIDSPTSTGIYTGKIIVTAGATRREIPVIINVRTEKSLFDITLSIPKSDKIVNSGEDLKMQINLLQMGVKENMDVQLNYLIKDFNGKVYLTESETIAVYNQKSFTKQFNTKDFVNGDYVVGVELIYPGGVAVASSQFAIMDKAERDYRKIVILSIISALIIISAILFIVIKRYKRIRNYIKEKIKR